MVTFNLAEVAQSLMTINVAILTVWVLVLQNQVTKLKKIIG